MKRCSRSLSGWATSFLLLVAVPAQAQEPELPHVDTPCAPEVTGLRNAVVTHLETPGFWFEREVARCMLGRLQALPLYSTRVRLLEQRLVLSEERDALRARQVGLAEEEAEEATAALEAAVRGRREAEEARDAWYRHPAFWAAIGGVTVVALEVLAVWALRELGKL